MNGELGKGCGSTSADSANNISHMACGRFLKLKVCLSHQTAGAAEGRSVEASDAAATSRWLAARRVIEPYFFSQTAKASAKARYPGRPFSMARMARLPLLYAIGMSNQGLSLSI